MRRLRSVFDASQEFLCVGWLCGWTRSTHTASPHIKIPVRHTVARNNLRIALIKFVITSQLIISYPEWGSPHACELDMNILLLSTQYAILPCEAHQCHASND